MPRVEIQSIRVDLDERDMWWVKADGTTTRRKWWNMPFACDAGWGDLLRAVGEMACYGLDDHS